MEMKTILTNVAKIIFPILLGGAILYWMYRGEDFVRLQHVLTEEMNWTWMLLSFPFGILAQMFRGWRWKQTLDPIEDLSPSTAKQAHSNQKIRARSATCIHAVFISYAASLVIPRIGEFSRCAVLKRYDGVSFSKALGTVVTERAVDTLIVMLYSVIQRLSFIHRELRLPVVFLSLPGERLFRFPVSRSGPAPAVSSEWLRSPGRHSPGRPGPRR